MKFAKKALSLALCIMMLATSMVNDGWSSFLQETKGSAMAGHEQNYNDTRLELDFNKGWSFAFSDDEASYLKGFDDSDWEIVDLPHDFSINQEFTNTDTEGESGNLPGGTGWYRKWFNLYDYYTGDRVILNFDGAYQHAYVYVNGQYVGENHYGYNSFSFEISDKLICSNTELNLIAVKVVNELPSSRWYSGSGIYRDVSLTIAGPVHTSLYGPQITTPDVEQGGGTASANITLHNDTAITKKVTVEATILDEDHNPVSETVESDLITLSPEREQAVHLEPKVDTPNLWSIEDPYLYKLKTVVKNEEGELIDEYHTTFGYRYIEWDANKGFKFNGEYMKLKGVCLHHDQGALGAAQEYDAIYRQLITLKEMGCNAIRTSHNSTSRILLEICNEIGMLVVEEFFDGWDAPKNGNSNDFSKYFNETIDSSNTAIGAHGQKWFEFVVEQTILRDEHDPCVIAWDVGNELSGVSGGTTSNYQSIVQSIVNIADRIDPSRVVLQGNNEPTNSVNTMIDSYMDVIGGNYNLSSWVSIMNGTTDSRTTKPFVATESASSINSRGVYNTMSSYDFQCTSYDTNAVSWGNKAAEAWYSVVTNDWFSGEFVWTGFDYIGEPTPWNDIDSANANAIPNSSYFGIVDTAGFEKDSYYLYRSLWNEESTTLHLVPGSWNRDKLLLNNGYVNVAVYSNAKKIELLLNGSVIATAVSDVVTTPAGYTYKTWTESITDSSKCYVGNFYTGNGANFYPQFSVKYAAGTLSVKAYDENNNEITDTVGSTKSVTGTATQIAVNTWQNKDTYVADGSDYIYVEFEARDANGNFMNDYNGTLNVKVDDSSARYAKIVGVDNGNAATTKKFQQSSVLISDSQAEIQMFNGRALVILRTTEEEGTINLTAIASDGSTSFSTQGVTVTSVTESGIDLTDELDEVIVQNNNKYEPTLYDEYEMVKYHIDNLEEPPQGSGSGSGGTVNPNTPYQIYLSNTNAVLPDGEYVIFNNNAVLTKNNYNYAGVMVTSVSDVENAPAGSAYAYQSLNTSEENVYTITHAGNNKYYIKNSAGIELFMDSTGYLYTFSGWKTLFNISANSDGSFSIYSDNGYYVSRITSSYLSGSTTNDDNAKIWLYSKSTDIDEPTTPPDTPSDGNMYGRYTPNSDVNGPIEDGEYLITINDAIMPEVNMDVTAHWGSGIVTEKISSSAIVAPDGTPYKYEGIESSDAYEYSFIRQADGTYCIKDRNGYYLYIYGSYNMLWAYNTGTQQKLKITPNSDGSIYISYNWYGQTYYITVNSTNTSYFALTTTLTDNCKIWLYSNKVSIEGGGDSGDGGGTVVGSGAKYELYQALLAGIETDPSIYTRVSYHALLMLLEEGVALCKKEDATDDEIVATTTAIYDAIDALEMDVKRIDGTLFKYGYSNTSGQDYSSGGLLMNTISVKKMKEAILNDANLVNQIKTIIDYNGTNTNWAEGYADVALEKVAEAYARIYSLQFTGSPINGSGDNSASVSQDLAYSTKVPVSLWNVWTKENTQGVNDKKDEGASIQGLASATLEDGVVKSHAAYQFPLSYANDGDSTPNDITNYSYTFNTSASATKNVRLDYLSGISVYFPDLFTRENLDTNGNVTTATTGSFSKYYWDAQFPIFISTDEYGVNTYHFDSSDTNYLVQSSFDDGNQTVDMVLNEVGSWTANGSISGSGFFPFNYQQGKTTYTGENAIYHYGFTFEHNFYIPRGGKQANGDEITFDFSGDDDVLVYIDGVLVLDNGGLHGARAATINFTNCTVNYQFAIDVADGVVKGREYETTYSYNTYIENPEASGYNADTIAALNKLHDAISDGEVHTLSFYYLERGSTDSNCKISFNLSEISEEVRIVDQNLTLDYGLPVEYNIQDNNNISQAATDNGVKVEYLGLCAVNEEVDATYTFEKPEIIVPFEEGVTYNVDGMKYGTCTIDKEGNTTYVPNTMNMTESEHFYVCAKITGDPTYAEEVVYYQIERTTFIPATAIYYEDTFDTITYTNGKVPSNYNNSTNNFGIWNTDGAQLTTLKQTANLTDSEANPYGYEENYMSFSEYSGGSLHWVDVSTRNNPNSKYSGGTGGAWPTADFTFTGTGFDLISITDNTSGALNVKVVNTETGKTVKSTVVDTFYGYNYGRIYSDDSGNPTLDSSFTPMYRSENGLCTSTVKYYDENGKITEVAHYYDANGNVVETQTDNPAYAYAYGWVVADPNEDPDEHKRLYQIPVIKITGLAYANYKVTITPTFTSSFGHASTAEDGSNYYSVYLDAIKIYSPAGQNDDIQDEHVKDAYMVDDEHYPNYLKVKDMLIGANSLSVADKQGVIFIDGVAALDNNIETYKKQGPNNELYLAKDQAVAFEIWATSVPTDVQIGAKLACGKPTFTISYDSKTTDVNINTATDLYYSFNSVLPNDGKLTWRQVDGADGNKYYTTGTVVVQNTGEANSVLSITNMKWTFSQYGGQGYFRIPTTVENEVLTLNTTQETQAVAYSLINMRTADLGVEQSEEAEIVVSDDGYSGDITFKVTTSGDVDSLVVTDKNGKVIDPDDLQIIASEIEGTDDIEWTVTMTEDKNGTYTYVVAGAYENGYTDQSKTITITVLVENLTAQPADIIGFYDLLLNFFRSLLAMLGFAF